MNFAELCLKKFESLPRTGKPNASQEWTVMAGVVLEDGARPPVTVALATGSKCLGFAKIDLSGLLLLDSHAEVLVKRAFQRWDLRALCHMFI